MFHATALKGTVMFDKTRSQPFPFLLLSENRSITSFHRTIISRTLLLQAVKESSVEIDKSAWVPSRRSHMPSVEPICIRQLREEKVRPTSVNQGRTSAAAVGGPNDSQPRSLCLQTSNAS